MKGTLFCEPLLLSKLAGNLPVAVAFFFMLLLDGKCELKAFEQLVLLLLLHSSVVVACIDRIANTPSTNTMEVERDVILAVVVIEYTMPMKYLIIYIIFSKYEEEVSRASPMF